MDGVVKGTPGPHRDVLLSLSDIQLLGRGILQLEARVALFHLETDAQPRPLRHYSYIMGCLHCWHRSILINYLGAYRAPQTFG